MIILKFLSAQGILCLKIVLVLSSFRILLFVLIIDPLTHGAVDPLGYISGGEGFLLVVQIEFILFKEDFHPASLFLIEGPKVLLKKCWRALPTFSRLWWRWNIKICLEFYLFCNYIDGFSFSWLLPFEL